MRLVKYHFYLNPSNSICISYSSECGSRYSFLSELKNKENFNSFINDKEEFFREYLQFKNQYWFPLTKLQLEKMKKVMLNFESSLNNEEKLILELSR